MDKIILTATKREESGKKNRALREAGQVPAIVYGHGEKPRSIKVDARLMDKTFAKAGGNKIIGLKVDEGKDENVLIHEIQQDGRTGAILHADLYLVKMDEKIRTEIPLHFIGESTAVYQLEGTLVKNLEEVEVEALPGDLPESIEVDISILDDFEKSIHVSDLKIPANVELLAEAEDLVARVEPPRSEEELAELDAEVEETLPEGVAEEPTEGQEGESDTDKEPKSE
ncbi:MAG TPA: 50S ribosomal protein L25 [Candidatus Nanoarchaeia archaeon]|nr:50S ribosomal protein L25 [Candidatus Nanoarchaeia archaeon]